MRNLICTLVLMGMFSATATAQRSNGYLFFAPGGITCCSNTAMTLHFGLGGEVAVGKGVGVGAELGALGPRQHFGSDVVGLFSPNGYYHFVHGKGAKVDPFVTGGYSLMFRSGHANLGNFGAGVNYWFHSRVGARFEFRDHIYSSGSTAHYWGFRFGVAFGSAN